MLRNPSGVERKIEREVHPDFFIEEGDVWELEIPYIDVKDTEARKHFSVILIKAIAIGIPANIKRSPIGLLFPRYGAPPGAIPLIKNGFPRHLLVDSTIDIQKIGSHKLKRRKYNLSGLSNKNSAYGENSASRYMPNIHISDEDSPIPFELWQRYAVMYRLMLSANTRVIAQREVTYVDPQPPK